MYGMPHARLDILFKFSAQEQPRTPTSHQTVDDPCTASSSRLAPINAGK